YHDYTETRPGIDRYLNVVRKGSTASQPAAQNLDTGEPLAVETGKGAALRRAGMEPGEEEIDAADSDSDSDIVIVHFPAVQPGGSLRLRISETYADPQSYFLSDDELIFDRALGRPSNAVVLPAGWYLTATSIPATFSETADGRIRLDFANPRPDDVNVLIKAKRRPPRR
ncbi:MAG: hypothetical protein M3O15_11445, partial [Acidobacteriota bacterium]|nr:hypothetical protein [Acidobacteriota bacterium]